MTFNRRQVMGFGAGAVAFALTGAPALATPEDAMMAVKDFAGSSDLPSDGLTLTTPEIAENGNTVPIEVSVDSPMTADNYVESVAIYADGNPNPAVVTFHFTPASGAATAKTRIRLAKTQNVVAVAKMNDGSARMVQNEVKVTIGGCGG
jgi:sulfur-oxidizing protein SoxY